MRAGDTIVALSSGSPPAGVAVVRLSGPDSGPALIELTGKPLPPPRRLTLSALAADGGLIDRGLVAWFPAPHSFTSEDCVELHLHGSRALVRRVLRLLASRQNCRLAEAGEFTRRAFENGKLDLTEVEGLGDLIVAETESQRRQALTRMDGALSERLAGWRARLLDLRADIEARLDFSDEGDVETVLPASFPGQVNALTTELRATLATFTRGRHIREGFRVALAGPPNAGKSSLLNALAGSDLAIVSDEAGTTRDVREVSLDIDGQLVVLIDMAGLRESTSRAEAEGVRRARSEIAQADLVLWLEAPDVAMEEYQAGYAMSPDAEIWKIGTKADLCGPGGARVGLQVSAHTGTGIATLLQKLGTVAGAGPGTAETLLISHERDRNSIEEALAAIEEVDYRRLELAAESLRRAMHALGRLIGTTDTEAVLDRLFTSFCIGK